MSVPDGIFQALTTTDVRPYGRTPTQAMTIDTERLRQWAAELGFWPATIDEADIERYRQRNTNADYWLARSHRLAHLRRKHELQRQRQTRGVGPARSN